MPTAMFICAGSRGDVEPFCALAQALVACQPTWKVLVCVQQDYIHLVPTHDNIQTVTLSFSQKDMAGIFQDEKVHHAAAADAEEIGDSSLTVWSLLARMASKLIVPCTAEALKAAEAAKVAVVVFTLLSRPVALTVADKLHAKACYVQLQPQVPTEMFPHHRKAQKSAEGIVLAARPDTEHQLTAETRNYNLKSYWDVERVLFQVYGPPMNAERESVGLFAFEIEEMYDVAVGKRAGMAIANAFPAALVPHVPDLLPSVHATGPLADAHMPENWQPPESLVEYLEAGPPPVCVGFGSVRHGERDSTSRLVLGALRKAGVQRVVVLGTTEGISGTILAMGGPDGSSEMLQWARLHVHSVEGEVPYAWLLPQCCVMVCQGGAGVVSAALRGGCALVVCPVLADQFMWGRLIDGLLLGAFAGPSLLEVSPDTLAKAVEKALDESIQLRVAAVQKRIQEEETGAKKFVKLLNRLVESDRS